MLGPVHGNTQAYARLETKQTAEYADGSTGSGGGYERWRSYEYRPETSRAGKEDVYVSLHRLHALIHPDLQGLPIRDALSALDGADIHHRNGCRFDNRLSNYELLDHSTHSELTQAELRAHASDAKEAAQDPPRDDAPCRGCRRDVETPATSRGFSGPRCIPCARHESDGYRIRLD